LLTSDDGCSDLDDGDEEQEDEVENEYVAVDVAASDEEEEAEVADIASVVDDEQPSEALNVPVDDYDVNGHAVANDEDGRNNINFDTVVSHMITKPMTKSLSRT
jgi:hypothetical protein